MPTFDRYSILQIKVKSQLCIQRKILVRIHKSYLLNSHQNSQCQLMLQQKAYLPLKVKRYEVQVLIYLYPDLLVMNETSLSINTACIKKLLKQSCSISSSMKSMVKMKTHMCLSIYLVLRKS